MGDFYVNLSKLGVFVIFVTDIYESCINCIRIDGGDY